ncbi:Glutamate-gated chloride channel alpha [Folsomia candida]|uniref:Glutamate-gated chloride channel alpha n=1 Tax=Folsomia candida TaxID=158441 RepID=A0A226F232_FOLCA|nr:Glutamate-gated chloride channel alpha [Folsomia candida]
MTNLLSTFWFIITLVGALKAQNTSIAPTSPTLPNSTTTTTANPIVATSPSNDIPIGTTSDESPTLPVGSTTMSTDPTTTPTTEAPDPKFNFEDEEEENFQADLSVLLPSTYVPYQLPVVDSSQFIPVFVSLFITSVSDIDEQGGQITIDAHFSRRWLDYKISKRITGPLKNVTLGSEALDKIWKPDIFFGLEKDAAEATQKTVKVLFNTNNLKDAQIAFSERTRLKLDCSMEFHYYPADTQICTYNLRSFSYKQNRLKLFWETPNAVFLRDTGHPNFDLLIESVWPRIAVNGSNKLFVEETFDPYRRGNYSALTFTIKARRKISYHLVQTYLPSILLVLMTWLCFLLPASMVEARIGISMTTVLTLTAMFAAVREQAPSVSYSMGIDKWMVFCIFVVFVSLLLFTSIFWMKNKAKKNKNSDDDEDKSVSRHGDQPPPSSIVEVKRKYSLLLRFTKYYAFFVFALAFVTFVVVYWWWLLTFSNYFDWNPTQEFNAVEDDDTETMQKPYFHYYRYLIEDAALLFNSDIYHPASRDTLRRVFGLVH